MTEGRDATNNSVPAIRSTVLEQVTHVPREFNRWWLTTPEVDPPRYSTHLGILFLLIASGRWRFMTGILAIQSARPKEQAVIYGFVGSYHGAHLVTRRD
jgi:hypothetical protein